MIDLIITFENAILGFGQNVQDLFNKTITILGTDYSVWTIIGGSAFSVIVIALIIKIFT